MHPSGIGNVAKERFSYPLRRGLARWGKRAWAIKKRPQTRILVQLLRDSGFIASRCPQMRNCASGNDGLRPRPLVADALQFHRPVGNGYPEGGADGALDQMDIAAMRADQFGGDRKAEPAAAGPAGGLERLE
jgi:hypothetical protein